MREEYVYRFDSRGILWGYLPNEPLDVRRLFEKLRAIFGEPTVTDELAIFFKYGKDIRVKITNRSLEFIRKSKIDKQKYGKYLTRELKANVQLSEADQFVRLLHEIGYEEGLFSYCTRYHYKNQLGSFVIRLNPIFGDFFQVNKLVKTGDDLEETRHHLEKILEQLSLTPWSDEQYEKHLAEMWQGKSPEPLVMNSGSLHAAIKNILVKYEYANIGGDFYEDETLQQATNRVSNDYTDLEKLYSLITNSDLLTNTPTPYANSFHIAGSIIIPTFNTYDTLELCLKSICNQDLTPEQFRSFEIIVVDDGSSVSGLDMIYKRFSEMINHKGANFNLVRMYNNQGRSIARNVGAQVAKNDVLFFIDSDIVLQKDYLRESMLRHQYLNKVILVGFKENVGINSKSVSLGDIFDRSPLIKTDFRFSKQVTRNWIGLYLVTEARMVSCINETDHFKHFGLGTTVGPFDLPCMVVSHNISVKRKEFKRCGGFDKALGKRWGFEDTFLGVNLIARGNFVIPLLSTGVFHIEEVHEEQVGIKEKKYCQLADNFSVYKNLVDRRYKTDVDAFV
ncbi:MAG: glycosyltransferase family 2 protein [Deltaproteobacteria bacterium]|nr:glycosyltransferase family 2 protein [Deltaproteobacteria bacterium]